MIDARTMIILDRLVRIKKIADAYRVSRKAAGLYFALALLAASCTVREHVDVRIGGFEPLVVRAAE